MNINKYASKAMSVMLCMAMALGSSASAIAAEVSVSGNVAYAENTENNVEWDAGESRYEDIEVTYSQGSSYHVTIPKTIALDANKQSSYSIKVEGDIAANEQVCVVPVDGIEDTEVLDFYMRDKTEGSAKEAIPAEINQSKFYWNSEEVSASYEETNNHIVAEGLSAGSWKGIFQMEISLRTDTSHIHNYVGTITKEPTCTEAGEKTYTCDCGDSYTEEIPATGHHYTGTITREPTCTEAGEKTYTCDCGDSYTEVIPATGHHYVGGTCTGCGEKDPDHVHSYTESITKEPTCVEDGEKTYTCICGDSYTEAIPATGKHNYVDGTCTGCGDTEDPYAVAPASEYLDWNYTLNEMDGTITLNYYIGSKENVTVYSNYTLNGKTYHTKIKSNNRAYNDNTNYMFGYCNAKNTLKSVVFGDNIDFSETKNMHSMFYGCVVLQNIDFGNNFDTGNVTDMSNMFWSCRCLESIDFGEKFDTGNVTNMNSMFRDCTVLEELDLSNFDTSNVTDMSYLFRDCNALESLRLGENFSTGSVTDMGYMFQNCSQLAELDLSNFDTGNVTNMAGMFSKAGLADIDISNWNTGKVISMNGMFGNMGNLKSVNMSNLYLSNVTDFDSMFYGSSSLTNVNFDNTVLNPVNKAKTMHYMFMNCSSLESLDLSGWDTTKVSNMEQMFYGCTNLKVVYATNGKWVLSSVRGNMFTGCGTSSVTYK
jgi:bacterial surface protein 26-residue repeat/bacterial surface protein 26-residue repeat/bacterial surface protein 26-residue repeat/bacterial surface protein 26-residue repeat/bacterial surface protein 26-residue repeat/bacterial surface protein 26-residue repeat